MNDPQTRIDALQREVQRLQARQSAARRTRRKTLVAMLFVAVLGSVAVWTYSTAAPGDAVPHTFASGEVISASEMNANFAELVTQVGTVDTQLQSVDARRTLYQKKVLGTDVTTDNTVLDDLTFTGLDITKVYRVTLTVSIASGDSTASDKRVLIQILDGSTNIGMAGMRDDTHMQYFGSTTTVFKPTSTVLTFETTQQIGATIIHADSTFAVLEEMPTHEATTQW